MEAVHSSITAIASEIDQKLTDTRDWEGDRRGILALFAALDSTDVASQADAVTELASLAPLSEFNRTVMLEAGPHYEIKTEAEEPPPSIIATHVAQPSLEVSFTLDRGIIPKLVSVLDNDAGAPEFD